ncbi:MAG: hypothetical protein AAGC93_17900 [Cyanobacteria bacterium P01_F01_bin.53]
MQETECSGPKGSKKTYHPPHFSKLGQIAELTQGGVGTMVEMVNMDMAMERQVMT